MIKYREKKKRAIKKHIDKNIMRTKREKLERKMETIQIKMKRKSRKKDENQGKKRS